jgi:hypothetical protein
MRTTILTPRTLTRARVLFAASILVLAGRDAIAQTDPLLVLKEMPPNVVVVLDTSQEMLRDGAGDFYDPKTYARSDDVTVANLLGVTDPTYRRVYRGLQFETVQNSNQKYVATDIVATQSSAATYQSFWSPSRWEMARTGVAQAVAENAQLVRWGLVKLRQSSPAWRDTASSAGCDGPVRVTVNMALMSGIDASPCKLAGLGLDNKYVFYPPTVAVPNYSLTTSASPVISVGSTGATTNILNRLQAAVGTGTLIPAGLNTDTIVDRPITTALEDARAHVVTTMGADTCRSCRNSVVVLVTSGRDRGDALYEDTHDPVAMADTFTAVSAAGVTRRVPIVVIGLEPDLADELQLESIAFVSGGKYFRATTAADVTAAMSYAVQLGFAKAVDVDGGHTSEFSLVSPIVGTVNLVNALSATGTSLPNTQVDSVAGATTGQELPQRSNFMLTAGFSLPGFDGRLRAFRLFKPVLDATKATGWRFEQDGTRLWPDLDGRPSLAGIARTPASASSRNIYTFIPNGAGGGQVVPFTLAEVATLAPHLGGANAAQVIAHVRAQPLGAVIGSTPAIMDPPSLDPPPDDDYGFPGSIGTYAGQHADRRSMIFFGANDGMVHAVDARTGYEVWAFIPYNLLPKLRTLLDGQSVEQFDYFVDSSPKVAEVKVGGVWRTMLMIGQSYGGTFYQAFDVTEAGMGVAPDADGVSAVNSLLTKFDTPNESISFSWAFPNYSSFDPNINFTATLSDGFPGGTIRLYGDLKGTASEAEKRVGFTFSDPAVGPLTLDRSVTAAMTGSGYFPAIETSPSLARGSTAPAAGRSFFLIDIATGLPLGSPGGACSGTGCYDVGDVSNGRKNAIQADVTAAGDYNSTVVNQAFVGDSDGRYRRFMFDHTGSISAVTVVDTDQPIYSSSALLFVGTANRYLFFGTGSDVLNAATPGGGSSGSGTAFRLYGVKDGASSGTIVFQKDLSTKVVSTGPPTNGERPTSSPTVAGDIVFFATTTDAGTYSCTNATAKIYAFTYLGTSAYDSSGNGKIDTNESPVVAQSTGRATAPFIVDQHLFIGTTSLTGSGVTIVGDTEDFNNGVGQVGVRILSWREIR